MATIKEVLQNFCYRINVPAPSAFVGVTLGGVLSPTEQQYLSFFQFIGDNLRNRPYQWPQLKRTYIFTTTTGERKIQLPGDFYRLVESSQYNSSNSSPLYGPVSDANFSNRTLGTVNSGNPSGYRIAGPTNYLYTLSPYAKRSQGWFEIDPPGQNSTDQLAFNYISCNWIWPIDWVTATSYTAGNIRSGSGYVYRAATTATSGVTRPGHATGSANDGSPGVSWAVYTEPYLCTPTNTALNDLDICLFDDDLMIEGMHWVYQRQKGLDYQGERNDWDNQVKSSYARFNNPTKVNMCDGGWGPGDGLNVPNGSWPV